MIKKFSKQLIGGGSLLFFIGLFTINIESITVNILIPLSTFIVVLGVMGWILKPKNESPEKVKYNSKVDKGLGFLWDKVIPKFWTGMILILMIIFNPFASKIHKKKKNWKDAKNLASSYDPIVSTFGTNLVFGNVNSWSYPNDSTTIFKFKISGSQKKNTNAKLTLSHGSKVEIINFEIIRKQDEI